jgi:hypothetical protein
MNYIYLNKNNPNLEAIHQSVYNSLMISKQIQYCIWNSDTKILQCLFLVELTVEDKEILDNIIKDL